MSHDLDLKRAFETLREDDRAALPDFRSVADARSRAARTSARHRVAWALVIGTAATVAAIVLLRPAPDAYSLEDAIAMATSVSAWSSPTDALLEIELPGSTLYGNVTDLELTSLALPEIRTADETGAETPEP